MSLRIVLAAVVLASAVTGCPPAAEKTSADAGRPDACAKVGQSCEFSPGKLGTCVQQDSCPSGATCFVCQSQH